MTVKTIPTWLFALPFACTHFLCSADDPPSADEVIDLTFSLTSDYFEEFQHPETGILYGYRLASKDSWTSPEDVLKGLPKPWGYGSRIADTVLHTGHMLVALIDAWEARPNPSLEEQIKKHFRALQLIGALPETHPKAGKSDLIGLVPRGPHPNDLAAYFDDSSMDQHTTYIISLAIYANSPLASEDDRAWIRQSLGKVGRRLEKHDWSIKRADGVTEAHVGFSWKGHNSSHASILLPSVLALYHGTGDDHWLTLYEQFMAEADGKRWEQVHPGPHIRINGHPIYANQNAFRVNAWHRFESDTDRRNVIGGLLRQSVEMQLARDFPGEMYRKLQPGNIWEHLSGEFNWGDTELRGCHDAWSKFKPSMLDHKDSGTAALSHVRFPLGGFHMVLLSKQSDLIRETLPDVWNMLSTVELEKIGAGETHYLFTVVALHLYALYFDQPELFESTSAGSAVAAENRYGPKLPIVANAGIGPTHDVVIEGHLAYTIGKSQLKVIDVSNPKSPKVLGSLGGLGSERQIVVRDSIAYITARQDGLFIVDATNPENPKLIAHYDTIEFATGIALTGDILLVACRHYGVELVDVSDPTNPHHMSTSRTGEAQSLTARDGYVYAGVWASSEVVTIDIRDPWNPNITSRAPLDGFGDGVAIDGNYLYAATGHHSKEQPRKIPGDPGFGKGHGLEVFDLSDPAHPDWVSRIKFPPLYEIGNDTWRVTVNQGYAFAADTYNGLFVLDVSDPANLRFVGSHQLPQGDGEKPFGFVGGLALTKGHVLMAGGDTDLHIVATELAQPLAPAPSSPPEIGEAPNRSPNIDYRLYQPGEQVYGIDFLSDERAVIACGDGGVHVVKLWPEIIPLSVFDTDGFATDIAVHGSLVYIAQSSGGLSICKMNDESDQLIQIGHFELPPQAIRQVEVPGDGRYVLVQAGASKFLILDAIDPTQPKLVLEDSRHGLLYGDQMMRGLVEDRYTTVFWHVSGTHWYDLKSDPPSFTGNIFPERLGSPNGQMALDNQSLATTRGGYVLLDRTEDRSIDEVGVIKYVSRSPHLGVPFIHDDRLYTARRSDGIVTVTDISAPKEPQLLEQFTTAGNPCRPLIRNGCLIIPDGYHGLMIKQISP